MYLLPALIARNHRPAAAQIDPVGPCTPAASGTSTATIDLGLPANAQAGDVVVAQLMHAANNSTPPTTSGPDGSIEVIADKAFKWLSSTALATLAVYLVPLDATDIKNGSVTFGLSTADVSTSAIGHVFRGVSESMLDWVSAWSVDASTDPVNSPASFSAPGYATVTDGAMLLTGAAIAGAAPPNQDLSTPDGFTPGASDSVDYNHLSQMAYATQAAHGDVAAAQYDYSQGSTNTFGWCAWQLALKPAKAAIELSATFPSNLHVGDTGSFVVTATLADGATGSLTITGASLPDGMTVGTTTDNGDGTFSATVSYDLTTVQDVTTTFSATGGSVAATGLVHEFVVQAVSASPPTVLQYTTAGGNSASPHATLDSAPTPGNYMVFVVYAEQAPAAGPDGFDVYPDCTGAIGAINQAVYYREVQVGDSASQSMTLSSGDNWVVQMLEVENVSSGLSSGVLTKDAGSLTIPAGVSGALPLVFTGARNIGFSAAWHTPTGFTQIAERQQSNQVAMASFQTDLSTGVDIVASPIGFTSGSSGWQMASGFLIK